MKRWKDKTVEEKADFNFFILKWTLIIVGVQAFFELVKLFGTLAYYGLL